ncbi:hypothetical protein M2138_000107 [Dysgonomonadaceae bacterium PH5-43]|nr:hypothetical protein [Dysgonomonadaceae bacterium PH5-43]
MIAIIVILILFIVFIIFLWCNRPVVQKKSYKVVKAGDVNCIRPYTIEINNLLNKKFVFKNEVVDPNDFEIFIVQGNSMSFANIKNNDAVLIKRLYGAEKHRVQQDSVLIFEIDNTKDLIDSNPARMIEFKLRKFIGYIRTNDHFEDWFKQFANNNDEMSSQRDAISDKYKSCVEKYKKNNIGDSTFLLIFSSTLDTENNTISYSFHPVKFLYGVVEYVINADNIV